MNAKTQPSYPATLIDESALRAGIAGMRRFGSLVYVPSTDSTNRLALTNLHPIDYDSISIVTEWQSAGRGRAGRPWVAPAGSSLLCSTVLPGDLPRESLPAIGFWAALALAWAVEAVAGVRAGMKWPNDLLLGAAKCAGILIESRSVGDRTRAVVGVGLNVNRPADMPETIATAGWLSDAAGQAVDRTVVAIDLLRRYEDTFDDLISQPRDVIAQWWHRSELEGSHVVVKATDGSVLCEGTAVRLAHDGGLLVRAGSDTTTIRLGDVSAVTQ